MNSIIEKLAAIEKTAEDIVDNAENQKFEAERQIQAERDEFDRKLEEEVNGRLEAIRSEARAKMDHALNDERLKHRSVIDSL